MKTVFSSHSQCAHVWAQQKQYEGRSGPLFFDGPAIFSYGRHYMIARFTDAVTAAGERVVLFNSTGSSMTTDGKHKPAVRDALAGLPVRVFNVPGASLAHANNLAALIAGAEAFLLSASRARNKGEYHLTRCEEERAEAQAYAAAFGLPIPEFEPISAETMAKAKAAAQKVRQAEADARKARELARQADILDRCRRWRAGESVSVPYDAGDTMLRLSGDGKTVQTSRGASVPVADARKLWGIVSGCAARGLEYRQPVSVGSFTLRSIAADGTCVVGCHTLTFAETRAFAKAQGWTA